MNNELKIIAEEELEKLPKELREAINSFEWVKMSEEIGKKYLLLEDEVNDLQVETLLVLVGIQDIAFYPLNIENEVGTSKEEAEKIAEEVNQKIFTPIYEKLTENIKKTLPTKNPDWEQSVNFILSGGDYSSFIEKK